ncbi:helix-turn-helix domain-containing protein [Marinicrinis lubricantis]|uniref:Helix-turn-helix domain-containing protein n=1 Tax=Marinicrinis lubricantis TaxID=2086470 RepID=A0ABW1INP0_9BACL
MNKQLNLREEMSMPDPHFPVKVNHCQFHEAGVVLFPHHWHQHIEFLYFVRGEARIECNSHSMEVGPGDLVVVNSNDLHHGVSLSEDLLYFALIADTSVLGSHSVDAVDTKYITPIAQNRILFQHKITNDSRIQQCMDQLLAEFRERDFGYELAIKSYLYQLLTILIRNYVTRIISPVEYNTRLRNLERFNPIFQYIEQHFEQKITVDVLAGLIQMSRFHFSRVFRDLTNKSVTEYVHMIRIHHAEHLLRSTTMTISEIALAAGYNDIYYFSRMFKQYKNVSPSIYRDSVNTEG